MPVTDFAHGLSFSGAVQMVAQPLFPRKSKKQKVNFDKECFCLIDGVGYVYGPFLKCLGLSWRKAIRDNFGGEMFSKPH